jgi:endo-1,4-beta-xylanase
MLESYHKIPALLIASLLPVLAAEPYKPLPILAGGEVIPLYQPDSPFLNQARISEPEIYNSTFNIHNPSIEVHLAPNDEKNTGTAIILAPGGGHKILWVDSEGVEWVPHFAKLGISTIVLRIRIRSDGYKPTIHSSKNPTRHISRSFRPLLF